MEFQYHQQIRTIKEMHIQVIQQGLFSLFRHNLICDKKKKCILPELSKNFVFWQHYNFLEFCDDTNICSTIIASSTLRQPPCSVCYIWFFVIMALSVCRLLMSLNVPFVSFVTLSLITALTYRNFMSTCNY